MSKVLGTLYDENTRQKTEDMIEKKLSKVVNMKEEVKFSESVSKIHYP